MRTLYSLLNCDESTSSEKLKRAYFALLREVHPDRSGSADFEKFLAINRAWQILGSSASRQTYNNWLREQAIRENKALIGDEIWLSPEDLADLKDEQCRCGGTYEQLQTAVFEQQVLDYVLLECSNCSLCLKVWRQQQPHNSNPAESK